MYRIAIAGASTLVGRELKEVLSESPLDSASFVLLDDEGAQGQLDQVGDEATFIQAVGADSFKRADFHIFLRQREPHAPPLATRIARRIDGPGSLGGIGSGAGSRDSSAMAGHGNDSRRSVSRPP